ncbi:3-isopropylmalate dehydratase small subunit [Verrucomicrobiaceae bacterium N1E253]|uniref:3-isopropylmalate dehydratase n=1 Tax=Oceaniferula marina TaxID=2748318 RepID=A0A851GF77_9BACT|nr:3-isopropylmalate dehydratase small subunit [Oceaniferula marina]NWK56183.1 3-isopropylmalate dehydratase small subunit [Oceaniferula marina]
MSLPSISQVSGTAVFVPGADIDTDRIIPARFLKCVTFDDLAEGMFYDIRFDAEGNSLNHPIDDPRFAGATIMLAGPNFGCGSSREHAPQSIYRCGFRAVIAESFAEIFFGNSTGIGMPCVCATKENIESLSAAIELEPKTEVNIDLEAMQVQYGEQSFDITMPDSAREALLSARWDPIQELLDHREGIEAKADALPYV